MSDCNERVCVYHSTGECNERRATRMTKERNERLGIWPRPPRPTTRLEWAPVSVLQSVVARLPEPRRVPDSLCRSPPSQFATFVLISIVPIELPQLWRLGQLNGASTAGR